MRLVREFYEIPGHSVGGALHIVLSDGNMDDCHITWCREIAATGVWLEWKGSPIKELAEKREWHACSCERTPCPEGVALCDLLLQMTPTQRDKVYRGKYGRF